MKKSTFLSLALTAGDTPTQITTDQSIIFNSINIHCYTNDAYYGNGVIMQAVIRRDAVVFFEHPVRAVDLLFQNVTPGSNATIVVAGPIQES